MAESSTQKHVTITSHAPVNVEVDTSVLHRKLYLAPIKNPQRVIDLATGTGIWAIDFVDEHPQTEVIGCDLSPTQPTLDPPKVKFLVDDIESEWAYQRNPFDFVHARNLAGAIRDFGRLITQCYRKALGWVEFQEWFGYPVSPDDSLNGTALQRYYNDVYSAFEKAGHDVQKFVLPYGVWPKDPHLTKEEVLLLANQARADGRKRNIHTMFNFYVVYGQQAEN
ncbi:hypothetical protein VTN49DRAFT_4246 [Thermomyces lanuginosus]|uniref:uncharacterized protein n=1 Tax=Thermomyces lanuginosus TaxID=5541 RepID=UPI0037422652